MTQVSKMLILLIVLLTGVGCYTALHAESEDYSQKEMMKLKMENEKLNLFVEKTEAFLKNAGYQTDHQSFLIKFKDIMIFNFSNKVYLGHKKLSKSVTNDICKIYHQVYGDTRIYMFSLPDGLVKTELQPDPVPTQNTEEINQTEESTVFIQPNPDSLRTYMQGLELFFEQASDLLNAKGYKTENVAFSMKFKNIWYLSFSNRVYLNQQRLPKDISKEIFALFYKTSSHKDFLIISKPDGLKNPNFYFNIK